MRRKVRWLGRVALGCGEFGEGVWRRNCAGDKELRANWSGRVSGNRAIIVVFTVLMELGGRRAGASAECRVLSAEGGGMRTED